jgi:PhnB protein
MNVHTYLFFNGDCRSAIELYEQALGAVVEHLTLFSQAPEPLRAPERDNLVFHATLLVGETRLNLADDPKGTYGAFGGFSLLIHLDSADDVDSAVDKLSVAGTVVMPPLATFWAERYAIVKDRFGITWKLQFS